jgi:hypothetical protein
MFWVICLGNPEEADAADWILNNKYSIVLYDVVRV